MNNNKETKLTLKVNDRFQNYIMENYQGLNKYALMNELIFYGIFVYYYYFGPIQDSVQNFLIVKYIISIIALRYVFNNLTTLNKENNDNDNKNDNKNDNTKNGYYQLNSKLAIFIIMILFLSKSESVKLNSNMTILIVCGYALLTSAINMETTTVDNIFTVVLIMYIYSLNLLS